MEKKKSSFADEGINRSIGQLAKDNNNNSKRWSGAITLSRATAVIDVHSHVKGNKQKRLFAYRIHSEGFMSQCKKRVEIFSRINNNNSKQIDFFYLIGVLDNKQTGTYSFSLLHSPAAVCSAAAISFAAISNATSFYCLFSVAAAAAACQRGIVVVVVISTGPAIC